VSLESRFVVARGFLRREDLAPRARKTSPYFSLTEQSSAPRLLLPLSYRLDLTNDDHRPYLQNYARTWLGVSSGENVFLGERGYLTTLFLDIYLPIEARVRYGREVML